MIKCGAQRQLVVLSLLMIASGAVVYLWTGALGPEDLKELLEKHKMAVMLRNDLGNITMKIETQSDLCQRYFNQGLRFLATFNFNFSIVSLRQAQALDPTAPMPYWCEALGRGSNLNENMDPTARPALCLAMGRAKELVATSRSLKEQELVNTLELRYDCDKPEPDPDGMKDRAKLYADAMYELAQHYLTDMSIQWIVADALMNTSPWDYWVNATTMKPYAVKARQILETALAKDGSHAGLIHLYLHLMEASAFFYLAEPYAEKLAALMPGAPHIQHMPSHIYIHSGRYDDAATANENAVALPAADAVYPQHNLDFLIYVLRISGRRGDAIEAAKKLVPISMKKESVGHFESGLPAERFIANLLATLTMFQQWDEIMQYPEPEEHMFYHRHWWHCARGQAFAARNQIQQASAELQALSDIEANIAEEDERYNLGFYQMQILTNISSLLLRAAIERANGNSIELQYLSEAVELEKNMMYDEPPAQTIPTWHYYGAALLRHNKPQQAMMTYDECLEKLPRDGWALFGVYQACKMLQDPCEDAAEREWRRNCTAMGT
jgi:hypothetical protein